MIYFVLCLFFGLRRAKSRLTCLLVYAAKHVPIPRICKRRGCWRNVICLTWPRVIIAPITSAGQPLGCRPEVVFQKKNACILLDQLRCVDKARLGKKMGRIDEAIWHPVLLEMLG